MRRLAPALLGAALVVLSTVPAQAATVYVENHGVDSSSCGAIDDPCRSIRRGLARAFDGDTVLVGPGRYGDLNRNGIYGEPGEDPETIIFPSRDVKALESRFGAAATIIEGSDIDSTSGYGTTIGGKGRGFTFLRSNDDHWSGGAFLYNRIVRNQESLEVRSGHKVRGNILYGNEEPLHSNGNSALISDNLSMWGAAGGFSYFGQDGLRNVAVRNATYGIRVFGSSRKDVAIGNGGAGFEAEAQRNDPVHDAVALGNGGAGIHVTGSPVVMEITRGMVVANDASGTNCGVTNETGEAISIPQVYWGSPTGPGPDPADVPCGDPITIAPIATKATKVQVKVGR